MITGLCDEFPRSLGKHRELFVLALLGGIYLCCLPTCTYVGSSSVQWRGCQNIQIAEAPLPLLTWCPAHIDSRGCREARTWWRCSTPSAAPPPSSSWCSWRPSACSGSTGSQGGHQCLQRTVAFSQDIWCVCCSAANDPSAVFTFTEKAPTKAFSLLKAPTRVFTFKNVLKYTMMNRHST